MSRAPASYPTKDAGGIGSFRNVCQFSHINFNDSLVFPGRQGATHLHTDFGNTNARFDSTPESLTSSGSSNCRGGVAQASTRNCTGTLTMDVTFAQCWDGVNLSSPDHKSHVAYPTGGGCPSSHPVPTPELSLHVHYTTTFGSSATWRLSSDVNGAPAGSSGHADWIHAWDTSVMDTWVRQVVNRGLSGGSHILGDGRVVTCNFSGCQ